MFGIHLSAQGPLFLPPHVLEQLLISLLLTHRLLFIQEIVKQDFHALTGAMMNSKVLPVLPACRESSGQQK